MIKAASIPARPSQSLIRPTRLGGMAAVALLILFVATVLWQSENVPQPYQASALDLTTSGALALSVNLTDLGALEDASFSSSGFSFTLHDAPTALSLSFMGKTEASVYDLSSGTNPLTLSLLEEGQVYHSFSATEGSVTFSEAEVTVSAFLRDDAGQQLFLNARFNQPASLQACSESYRFCFSGL